MNSKSAGCLPCGFIARFERCSQSNNVVPHFCCISVVAMPCDEAIKLRADYDAALMRWGQTLDSELRLAALKARNEIAARLVSHGQTCAVCRRDKMKLV